MTKHVYLSLAAIALIVVPVLAQQEPITQTRATDFITTTTNTPKVDEAKESHGVGVSRKVEPYMGRRLAFIRTFNSND